MADAHPAPQFAALPQQHEAAELGMWTFLATEVLFFGGLILAYVVYRMGYPDGFAAAARHTDILIGTINTAVLLTSSFAVAWAVDAAKVEAGRLAAALLIIAAVLGVVFLGLKGIEYAKEYDEHLIPGINFAFAGPHGGAAELFFVFYFVANWLQAINLTVGVIVLLVMARMAQRGAFDSRYHSPIVVAGLYWHFVDMVWVFLFALIYLPGRSG